jgi:hypothetical protein
MEALNSPPHRSTSASRPAFFFEDRTDPEVARALVELEWAERWVRNKRARGEQPS